MTTLRLGSDAILILVPMFAMLVIGAVVTIAWIVSAQGRLRDSLLQELQSRSQGQSAETREAVLTRLAQFFLDHNERLERTLERNTQSLEGRFQGLERQVTERLIKIGENVEAKLNQNLKEGFQHFERVQEHLKSAELKLQALGQVGQSISDLNQLLRLPHLRGGFGEQTLERLLADFLPSGSFELQVALTPQSTERVDAVVRLARQVLPIDSKFPREQVLPLFETENSAQLEEARRVLAQVIRGQAKSIADKYIKPEHGTTDMALLFLPSETLYFEVVRNGKLFEELSRLKVFPVSPNTLAIGLKSVSIAHEYYEMSRGVERTIEEIRKARKHFDHFEGKFEDVGRGLRKAQEAFETANTHLGRYGSSVGRLTGAAELPLAPTSSSLTDASAPLIQE